MAEADVEAKNSKAETAVKAKMLAAAASRKQTTEFINFVREQGVVGLAVGLAIGVAAGAAVKDIVDGFISPLVGFILGGADLLALKWETGLVRGGEELVFAWGAVANSMIILLATAFVIYQLIHIFKLDKMDKPKDK